MHKYALLIGNSKYEDPDLAKLKAPETDAYTLARLLQAPDIGGFDSVETLIDRPFAEAQRAIASLFSGKRSNDLLLLYFSGHGTKDSNNRFYLAARDTNHNLLSGTAIADSFIKDQMNFSLSKRQVLILDCCYSGAFAEGVKAIGTSVGAGAALGGFGRVVLTASDALQYSWDGGRIFGYGENSVFTHFLIDGIQTGKADANTDGNITLDELFDYAYARVREVAPHQTPTKTSVREQDEIILVRNPNPIPVELLKDVQGLIRDPRAEVRRLAVEKLAQLLQHENKGLGLSARQELQKLAEDDSRLVSSAALHALGQNPAPAPPIKPVRPAVVMASPPNPVAAQPLYRATAPTPQTPVNWWKRGSIVAIIAVVLVGLCLCALLASSSGGSNCWYDPYYGWVCT